jgi:hypothetical protein
MGERADLYEKKEARTGGHPTMNAPNIPRLSALEGTDPLRALHAGVLRAVCVFMLASGCTVAPRPVPVARGVDFAAHVEHRGLVVDDMAGGSPAALVPAAWLPWSGGPRFLLQHHGETMAAVWIPKAGRVIVRQSSDPQSPLIGEVDAAWKDGAIHLTFLPAGGPVLQSSTFDRIDGRVVTAALSSQARTVLDVRGVYRAEVRDAQGNPVGWMRARISPHQTATRIYDGVLPASLNGPLTTAAFALLDAEVDYIEDHALDVYLGS